MVEQMLLQEDQADLWKSLDGEGEIVDPTNSIQAYYSNYCKVYGSQKNESKRCYKFTRGKP